MLLRSGTQHPIFGQLNIPPFGFVCQMTWIVHILSVLIKCEVYNVTIMTPPSTDNFKIKGGQN